MSGMSTLLMPREVDRLLRYPRGRSLRLARAGKLPHIKLPDGEIRFDEAEINSFLQSLALKIGLAAAEGSHAQ
jgi:hypothetical protein